MHINKLYNKVTVVSLTVMPGIRGKKLSELKQLLLFSPTKTESSFKTMHPGCGEVTMYYYTSGKFL